MDLQLSIDKELLHTLDTVIFEGEIVLVDNIDKLKAAMEYLSKQPIVGFDTESRPAFKKGVHHDVSLVQISTLDRCYLIRLNCIGGMSHMLIRFFENSSILKIGLSLTDDISRLHAMCNFKESSFVDLQKFVKDYAIRDNALQRIYAIIFNKRISKGQRLTNWEASALTEMQQRYAATDAWACLKIYNYLKAGLFDPTASPYVYHEDEETTM